MNAKTSPPPPSSFRNKIPQSSSGIEPFSSESNSKPKRQSMNVASSSTGAGPRPLHLALGSVVNASPAISSPSTSSLGTHTPSEANETSVIDASTSKRDSIQSATSSRGQSPLPLSPTVASLRKESASRKRSSISYIPSTPSSPSYLQTNRHDVLDSPSIAPSPLGMGSGLARTSSLGRKGSRTPKSATFAERASTGSMLTHSDSNIAAAMAHLKERPPLTLNEKHADLLHFIAQKESKCLELRSQLAVHEAELLQLKRKWEKIVNRGFEKALSPNTASSSSLSISPSSAPSPYPPESISSANSSTAYFPTLNPTNANAPATVVLEGIKESVQGMSRLIAAGLGSIAQVNAPPDSTAQPNAHPSANTNAPLPLRLGAVSQRRANDSGHGQTESQSSSSTMMSAASNMSSSSFLSASTTSSATSAGSSSSMTDSTTKVSTSDADADSEFGEFTDGSGGVAATRQRSATLTEHLMVQDTGATPTMSPNPHFERRKLRVNDRSSSSLSLSSNANTSSGGGSILLSDSQQETDSSSKDDFDWDDAWDDPVSEVQMNDHFANSNPRTPTSKNTPSTSTSASAYAPTTAADSAQSRDDGLEGAESNAAAKGPLSPMPAIPGLAAMGMGVSTPTTQQMSSWVGSVGKKWGEIKGSSAFTKNQKRASVLLSDIQQTFVSSLISPTSTSDSAASFSNSSYPSPTTPPSYSALSSNACHTNTPATPSSKIFVSPDASSVPARPSTQRGVSLIDDSDDESFGESAEDDNKTMRLPLAAKMMSTSVMVPDSVPSASKAKKVSKVVEADVKDADDEEWNW